MSRDNLLSIIDMPYNAAGEGPEMAPSKVVGVDYEIWNEDYMSIGLLHPSCVEIWKRGLAATELLAACLKAFETCGNLAATPERMEAEQRAREALRAVIAKVKGAT